MDGPTSSLEDSGGQKGIPTLVDVLVGAMTSRCRMGGHVDMTQLLVFAGGTIMAGGDAIPMRGAEATGDHLPLMAV